MKKQISEKHEYPNMTPREIIDLGYELSGDALGEFAQRVWKESSKSAIDTYENKSLEAQDEILQSELF